MAKKKILTNHEQCSGCMSCILACSLFNFNVVNPEKSFITLDKDDERQSFTISVAEGCKSCGECIAVCAYKALGWEDENSHN
jgi:Fe-S-cluster-containing dehydrogenase component